MLLLGPRAGSSDHVEPIPAPASVDVIGPCLPEDSTRCGVPDVADRLPVAPPVLTPAPIPLTDLVEPIAVGSEGVPGVANAGQLAGSSMLAADRARASRSDSLPPKAAVDPAASLVGDSLSGHANHCAAPVLVAASDPAAIPRRCVDGNHADETLMEGQMTEP